MSIRTEFISPTEKGKLIERSASDRKALAALLNEFDRLENRIRTLEIVIETAISKSSQYTCPNWEEIVPAVHGVTPPSK